MAFRSFKISPSEWKQFDTYEGSFQIEELRKENVTIMCDNLGVVSSLFGDSLLPDFFAAEKGVSPKLDRVRLTFRAVSYFKLRGTLFDPIRNAWVVGADSKEIMLNHDWGSPDPQNMVYEFSGVGRIVWPPIGADEFVIESSEHLAMEFDDETYFPTGFRTSTKSEQGIVPNP